MTAPSPSMRDLARRLLEINRSAAPPPDGERRTHEAVEVCERLRNALSRFAGPEGFAALLRRALALARAEVPALQAVRLGTNCHMEGLDEVPAGESGTATVALAAYLLELLVTFIGEPLTLRMVREAWPDNNSGPDAASEYQRPE